jgi:hypothetical protein
VADEEDGENLAELSRHNRGQRHQNLLFFCLFLIPILGLLPLIKQQHLNRRKHQGVAENLPVSTVIHTDFKLLPRTGR